MSEFKFSCPNCQQNIRATSEYSGHQINCPACQTPIVVPAAPDAPEAPAPHAPRLSKTPSTPHQSAAAATAAAFYGGRAVHKKKPKTGLIVGLSLGACAVVAAILFGPTLMKRFSNGEQAAAASQTPTNASPTNAPPPELTTEEILQKVGETYKGMTDYGAKAQTLCSVDMSGLGPGKGLVNLSTTSSLQLGRTNNYRLEWEQNASGKTVSGAAWCSGKGNFVGYASIPPSKVKTRQAALAPFDNFFVLDARIAELFFSDTNSFAAGAKNFTKTNGPSLNGQDCYVLAGEASHQSYLIWVDKSAFLIAQIEEVLGTKIDEAELKKLPSALRNYLRTISKLKGSVTATYDSIQTNKNLLASAFESSYKPVIDPAAARPMRSMRPTSRAGQLLGPIGRRQRP